MTNNNVYNKTDLDPLKAFKNHVFHRDRVAHYLRWSFILKHAKVNENICDFGCGKGNLLEVFYRNGFKLNKYTGLDIRGRTINNNKEKFKNLDFVNFIEEDLVTLEKGTDLNKIQADKVISFEVIEHVGKNNGKKFLENFKYCGNENAIYYLSTPKYDEKVGAAANHTYPNEKGGEPVVQEYSFFELEQLIKQSGFEIIDTIGTFASQRDYKDILEGYQIEMYNNLKKYFDSVLVSVIMAPIIDAKFTRNVIWILKRK